MTTSASPASTSESAAAAASAAPAADSIALKIRTLDQKTYPLVVRADASVPQLKEVVASETGVVLARQRLIFRGKVLKNDQSIAAYALEDGHVVHLVVRAEEAVAAEAEQQQRQQQQQQQAAAPAAGASRGATRNRTARNNDEPDPTVGLSPRPRVVMGATIAVPDDMPMPFLNSMIANFVNSMGSAAAGAAGAGGGAGGGGLPGAGDDAQRTQRNRDLLRRLRRARNNVSNAVNDAGATATGGSRRRARDGSEAGESMSFANSLSGSMLRDAAESQLRRLEQSLSNQSFDLPELQPRDEAEGTAPEVDRNDEVVQAQLAQLRGYIERFGPRMDRLPAALREIGWYARQNQEAPHDLVSSTVRAIDTLQSVGDSASTIARFARHVFLANSPDIPAPMVRIDDRGTLRASLSFPIMGGGVLPPNALPRTRAERQQTRGLQPIPTASTSNDNGSRGNNDDAVGAAGSRESPGVLRSLYQRVTSGLLGTGGSDARSESETATSAANPGSPAVLHPDDDGDVGMNQFTISALSRPYRPVFPMSFSGGGLFPSPEPTNRPEWDIIGLWQRLVRDLRAGTAFGILRGDPVALYDLMRSLATIFVAGVYTPSLTSTPVRVWARRFLIAVRRVLSEQTIPAQILNLTHDGSSSRLVEELTRPLDPFMPELVDHIRRSNSASQGDVFGRSCTDFLRNMAIQFLERVRAYTNGDEAHVTRLLEGILVALDVDQGLATYVVAKLIEFSSPVSPASRGTDGDAPATKRARRE